MAVEIGCKNLGFSSPEATSQTVVLTVYTVCGIVSIHHFAAIPNKTLLRGYS